MAYVELWRHTLYNGPDPFTPPHTKVIWVKTSIPGVKAPVIKKRFLYGRIYICIEGQDQKTVKDAIAGCLKQASVAGALAALAAAYGTGGAALSAAVSTFSASLISCIDQKLSDDLLPTVKQKSKTNWGGWQ